MRQPTLDDLTPRELEVLHWLTEGKTSGETGIIISCSEATVKKHRCQIYRTLGVPNAIAAANFYRDALGPSWREVAVPSGNLRYPLLKSRKCAEDSARYIAADIRRDRLS